MKNTRNIITFGFAFLSIFIVFTARNALLSLKNIADREIALSNVNGTETEFLTTKFFIENGTSVFFVVDVFLVLFIIFTVNLIYGDQIKNTISKIKNKK